MAELPSISRALSWPGHPSLAWGLGPSGVGGAALRPSSLVKLQTSD